MNAQTDELARDAAAALAASTAAQAALADCAPALADLARRVLDVLAAGGTVFWAGNGGSAAEAQHAAAELMGRYLRDRPPLRSLSVTVDTSALTAIANDYGYEEVFARQLRGLGRRGDLVILLSTSGESPNAVRAAATARMLGLATAALTGERGGTLAAAVDLAVRAPSGHTPHIQEMHLALIHALCGLVETRLAERA